MGHLLPNQRRELLLGIRQLLLQLHALLRVRRHGENISTLGRGGEAEVRGEAALGELHMGLKSALRLLGYSQRALHVRQGRTRLRRVHVSGSAGS